MDSCFQWPNFEPKPVPASCRGFIFILRTGARGPGVGVAGRVGGATGQDTQQDEARQMNDFARAPFVRGVGDHRLFGVIGFIGGGKAITNNDVTG